VNQEHAVDTTIPEEAHRLLDDANFGHVATVMPDGSVQSTPVWVMREGDVAVFNTAKGRTKYENLLRDPRVTLSVHGQENPYQYLQIRGRAEIDEGSGLAMIHELSHKYMGRDYPYLQPGEERVTVRITAEHVQYQSPRG